MKNDSRLKRVLRENPLWNSSKFSGNYRDNLEKAKFLTEKKDGFATDIKTDFIQDELMLIEGK